MVEVFSISFTSFEDGSVWLSYKQDEDLYGYELRYPKDILNPINEDKTPLNQLACEHLIKDVLYSDNEMLYIDEYEDKGYFNECKALIEADLKICPELKDYIDYEPYDDFTDTIVISGGIITKVLFSKE